jgi:hypothetical protein
LTPAQLRIGSESATFTSTPIEPFSSSRDFDSAR